MNQNIIREEKMREIFETAQKMRKGEMKPAKSYESIEAFIDDMKRA
jgi:hypothetical protein